MIPGETILSGAPSVCSDCGKEVTWAVMRSAAGYYVGTLCDCGPYSRETEYLPGEKAAEIALAFFLKRGKLVCQRT